MPQHDRRVVLVTGASSGIGLACAQHLARRGLRVYGTSRRSPSPSPSPSLGPSPGPTAAPDAEAVTMIPMDVTGDQSVAEAVQAIFDREGRLDIVVNNAGLGYAGPLEFASIDEARGQFEVNVFGALRVCKAVLPAMRRRGAGYIVNIGSIAGLIAVPYQGLYSASKFALEGMSEALRLEAAPFGVRVVLIEPGDFKTGFTDNRRVTESSVEPYRTSFEAALARMVYDERHGQSPEPVARLLYRIVNTSSPRLRYTVGPAAQRAGAWLKRWLPNGVVERGLRTYFRLR